jgi:hypothetical protein
MPTVKQLFRKLRRNKVRTLQQAPSAQQFEIAFNVISNINNYKIQSFNSSIEVLPNDELLEVLDLLSGTQGSMTTENKIRRISEYCGVLRTIVGIRNLMTDALNKLQVLFVENLISEYPSSHTLVDTRKIKETIKILLAVRAATTSIMSDR